MPYLWRSFEKLLTIVGGHFKLALLESSVCLSIWCLEEHRLLWQPQPYGGSPDTCQIRPWVQASLLAE